MELVDVVDSKSTASDGVPVRVRPPAPKFSRPRVGPGEFFVTVGLEQDGGPQAAKNSPVDCFLVRGLVVRPPAPLRNDLWMSDDRLERVHLDSKGLSSFKTVTADVGSRFCISYLEIHPSCRKRAKFSRLRVNRSRFSSSEMRSDHLFLWQIRAKAMPGTKASCFGPGHLYRKKRSRCENALQPRFRQRRLRSHPADASFPRCILPRFL